MKLKGQFLCLVLAVVALLGSFSSASATFIDESTIKYKTAVGVINGTGIINGYMDGSFKPNELITREQAAKLITYAIIGEEGITQLPIAESCFRDVPAERWSARYINWCREQGLADGLGDGTYNPEGNVTGYQMAKMLLSAAGYGKNGEYAGPSWELRVAKDGFAKGIFAGVDADLGCTVTREEAALYIFNAITKIEQVRYDAVNAKYVPADGTEEADNTLAAALYGIITTGSKANTLRGIVTENAANSMNSTVVNAQTLDYKSGLELLGHSVCVYSNGQDGIKNRIYYIADESETVKLEQKISGKKDFEKEFAGKSFPKKFLVYTEEGSLAEEATVEKATVEGLDPSAYTAPAGTYVFYEDALISYLPIYPEFGAVVSQSEDEIGQVTIGDKSYPSEAVYAPHGYAVGDVVLARILSDKVSIQKARSITGVISRVDTDSSERKTFTVNGMNFSESTIGNKTGLPKFEFLEYGKEYRFYLDNNYGVFAIVSVK